jgi:hypothetical protein
MSLKRTEDLILSASDKAIQLKKSIKNDTNEVATLRTRLKKLDRKIRKSEKKQISNEVHQQQLLIAHERKRERINLHNQMMQLQQQESKERKESIKSRNRCKLSMQYNGSFRADRTIGADSSCIDDENDKPKLYKLHELSRRVVETITGETMINLINLYLINTDNTSSNPLIYSSIYDDILFLCPCFSLNKNKNGSIIGTSDSLCNKAVFIRKLLSNHDIRDLLKSHGLLDIAEKRHKTLTALYKRQFLIQEDGYIECPYCIDAVDDQGLAKTISSSQKNDIKFKACIKESGIECVKRCRTCDKTWCTKCEVSFEQSTTDIDHYGMKCSDVLHLKTGGDVIDIYAKHKCPNKTCRVPIEKIDGCNKVICRCGTKMCYICGCDISDAGYNHFDIDGNCTTDL